jgi:ribosomal protein S27E
LICGAASCSLIGMKLGGITLGAAVILFVASVIHSWYAGNASLPRGHAAPLVRDHGGLVFTLFTLLLLVALGALWAAEGFWFAIGGAGVYFLVFPLITLPLLTMVGLTPGRLTCPQCGSEYEIVSSKVRWRDSDSIECEVCGLTLKKWAGGRTYAATILKRGEWPKKEPTQI